MISENGLNIDRVQRVVEENFPGLWPIVDLGLTTAATLLLADNCNPSAVIFVGGPSSSKTTVVEMFGDHERCYLSDNFTPASFVTHAANVSRDRLAEIDLLPRIRHTLLLTPELAPLFRGKQDDLVQRFAILTRVLDGQGLQTDSGTHGRRGYRGDYLFAWLGCTTPFSPSVWQAMAQLGSRLFFYRVPEQQVTVDDLLRVHEQVPYRERVEFCREVVQHFLTDLFTFYGDVRGVQWDSSNDDGNMKLWLAYLAKLLVATRGANPLQDFGSTSQMQGERPWRAHAGLFNLARAHALVHGRRQLTMDDFPPVADLTVSSMPDRSRQVFKAMLQNGGTLTVHEAQIALNVDSPQTARAMLQEISKQGVFLFVEDGVGKTAHLRFCKEWEWLVQSSLKKVVEGICSPIKI